MHTSNDLTLSNSTMTLSRLEKLKLWFSQNKTTSSSSTQNDNTTSSTSQEKIHPLLKFALTCCPSLKSLELHDLSSVLLSLLVFDTFSVNSHGGLIAY
jgi:hypothetical protein